MTDSATRWHEGLVVALVLLVVIPQVLWTHVLERSKVGTLVEGVRASIRIGQIDSILFRCAIELSLRDDRDSIGL